MDEVLGKDSAGRPPAPVATRSTAREAEDYRISILVDDVVAIAEELGWTTFDLVGHDWGGAVA
ncbi:hypothetical protein SBI_09874 [Streptomyces bingchenggensis BCW-1]|uniref:AB hydrolase-1 domain-containing protein n=1 Tax=Streptomyces bingchenggensis (strain BCW-1) TaxID=749414 RepID=D7CDF0_STRBB|nr:MULTISPECIES: alpha/beta fold hydrolase [Streptomyces]ADI12992.1 hypothetical protein SBI_09874 [Streptomyces bingchenggensis BCW-1]